MMGWKNSSFVSGIQWTKQAKLCLTISKLFPFLSDLDIKELQAFLCRKIDNAVVYTAPRWIPPQALCKLLWGVLPQVPHRGHGSAWLQGGRGMVSSWVHTNMCTGILTLVPMVFQKKNFGGVLNGRREAQHHPRYMLSQWQRHLLPMLDNKKDLLISSGDYQFQPLKLNDNDSQELQVCCPYVRDSKTIIFLLLT